MRLFFALLVLTGIGSFIFQDAAMPSVAIKPNTVHESTEAATVATKPPVQPVATVSIQPAQPDYVSIYGADKVTIMQGAGIDPADYYAVNYILDHESGWCPTKSEGEIGVGCPAYHGYTSAGYGLCQSTPADKMAIMGAGWETDAVLQLKWCTLHADYYGGWQGSYQHWLWSHNW